MRAFSDWSIRVKPPKETLLLLLGLVSTWQIVTVAGFALSTWLTFLTLGYLLITRGLDFRKNWLILMMLATCLVTTALSLFIKLPSGYVKASVLGFVQRLAVLLLCLYACREDTRGGEAFMKGFSLSCHVQLFWAILQLGLFKVAAVDINRLIFSGAEQTSHYRGGTLVCTGLHWHAANLIPILVFEYFHHPKLLKKGVCVLIALASKNATGIIAVILCLGVDFVLFVWRTLTDRQCGTLKKTAAWVMAAAGAVCLLSPMIIPKAGEVLGYLLLRLYQAKNPSLGNESSAVHLSYYTLLPKILTNISLPEVIFGSGVGTSGYRFTQFNSQYPDKIWTVESDFTNILLSLGVVGLLLHIAFLVLLTKELWKHRQTGWICVIWVLAVCGFVYANQFLWVFLVELMLYCMLKSAEKGEPKL